MTSFDEKMKERARAEDCPIPEGFDGRVESVLADLPERRAGVRRPRRLRRVVLAAAAAAVLCVGGAVAVPELLPLVQGGYSQSQLYSAEVGASVTDQGYTLTLDGIAVDEAFITLYATITGEEPIPSDEQGDPALWSLDLKAEGRELEFWGRDVETEWIDPYTVRYTQRCPVLRTLPDQVELQVYSHELLYGVTGSWELDLLVDKSAPDGESLVVQPQEKIDLLGHKVTVDKVVVAPSGAGMVLTEASDSPVPDRFLLRDDQGRILPHRWCGIVSRPGLPISNYIEFYGGTTDMTSLTIVPWVWADEDAEPAGNHKVVGYLDELPLTDDHADEGFTLTSLEVGESEAVGYFQTGQTWLDLGYFYYGTDFWLLDEDGRSLELGQTYMDRELDRETGVWTVTIRYPEADPAELAKAVQVAFWQPNDTIVLQEDQAITIDLT